MNVVVSTEHRFARTPDGSVWTQTMVAYPFWTRYLQVFAQVRILARVQDVETVPLDWHRATGSAVSFGPVPYYLGPKQYLLRLPPVRRTKVGAVGPRDAVILRLSSPVAATIVPFMRRTGHPYGVEVVGDPYDVFAPGAVRHPLRPFCRWWFPQQLRRQCATACAAAYVTEHTLQRRYPVAPGALPTSYSSVELPDAAFMPAPRPVRASERSFTLITVGLLAQLSKAPAVLIDAVALCVRHGLDLSLILVCDGKHRLELDALAAASGLGERVFFR
ncbi:MAG: glycosyl transferase family 1, partial [Dehalococcoidia bacterium]